MECKGHVHETELNSKISITHQISAQNNPQAPQGFAWRRAALVLRVLAARFILTVAQSREHVSGRAL